MRKTYYFIGAFLIAFIFGVPGFLHAETIQSTEGEAVNCFDYYHFGSIKTDFHPEKVSYQNGEEIFFTGTVKNSNEYPVIGGGLYVQVLRKNEEGGTRNGDHIIDEFFVQENIYLNTGEEKKIDFSWKLPEKSIKGEYKMSTFFIVDRKFNLSGLSFLNHMYAGFVPFSVMGEDGGVYFDRNGVKINDDAYYLRTITPPFSSDEQLVISVPIHNTSQYERDVDIAYKLYYWDALQEENLINEKGEKLHMGKGDTNVLTYVIEKPERSVYYLQIIASDGASTSIINVRPTLKDIEKQQARVNYAALTKFPLEKGEEFSHFVCYHNASGESFEGKVESVVKDKNGTIIDTLSQEGMIGGNLSALKHTVAAVAKYNYLEIETRVYDKEGNTIEDTTLVYDCGLFGEEGVCLSALSAAFAIPAAIIIFLLAVATFVYIRDRDRKQTAGLVALAFLLLSASLFLKNDEVRSYDVLQQATPQLGASTYIINNSYSLNLSQGGFYLTDGQTLASTDPINFEFAKDGEWIVTGSYVDSPAILWDQALPYNTNWPWIVNSNVCSATYDYIGYVSADGGYYCVDGNCGDWHVNWWAGFSCNTPNKYVEAVSGPASCVGNTCTITGPGTIQIKTGVGATSCQGRLYGIYDQCGPFNPSSSDWILCINSQNRCSARMVWNGSAAPADEKIWTFTVPSPGPSVNLSASPNPVNYNNSSTLSWTSTSVDSCTASGDWSGSRSTSGDESTGNLTSQKTYSLLCTGAEGDASDSVVVNVGAPAQCQDGVDNDGDGWIDNADPGCLTGGGGAYNSSDNSESVPVGTKQCSDNADNDGDSFIDGNDPDCTDYNDDNEALEPDFSLRSSNDVDVAIVSGLEETSSITTITVDANDAFNSNVSLSVSNINPPLPGASYNFGDSTLSSSEYGAGSSFSITVPGTTSSGLYAVTIQGVADGLSRIAQIILNIRVTNPSFENF